MDTTSGTGVGSGGPMSPLVVLVVGVAVVLAVVALVRIVKDIAHTRAARRERPGFQAPENGRRTTTPSPSRRVSSPRPASYALPHAVQQAPHAKVTPILVPLVIVLALLLVMNQDRVLGALPELTPLMERIALELGLDTGGLTLADVQAGRASDSPGSDLIVTGTITNPTGKARPVGTLRLEISGGSDTVTREVPRPVTGPSLSPGLSEPFRIVLTDIPDTADQVFLHLVGEPGETAIQWAAIDPVATHEPSRPTAPDDKHGKGGR